MRRKLHQLNEMGHRITEYEEMIQRMTKDNEQLNFALEKRNKESKDLEERVA